MSSLLKFYNESLFTVMGSFFYVDHVRIRREKLNVKVGISFQIDILYIHHFKSQTI